MNIDLFKHIENDHTGISGIESQLFMYALSGAMFDMLTRCNKKFSYVTGYSMGMFSSLFASGAMNYKDGLNMLYELNNLVTGFSQKQSYAMMVVRGLTEKEITNYLKNVKDGDIEVINQNSDESFVLSGISPEMEKFLIWANDRGVLTTILPITHPYHTRFLSTIEDEWAKRLQRYNFCVPQISILCSSCQKIVSDKEGCRKIALTNIFLPFSWYKTIKYLEELGIEELVECGPSTTLSKIGMFIPSKHTYINIRNLRQRSFVHDA
ncbi:MAG: ACP S-malonyltransferase [Candidatus Brocadiaceae bacterium]|nr:ACP S-malonyltransferase [Candidatus Brocadiaceae bacterium]